jgi:hypothetical protein
MADEGDVAQVEFFQHAEEMVGVILEPPRPAQF